MRSVIYIQIYSDPPPLLFVWVAIQAHPHIVKNHVVVMWFKKMAKNSYFYSVR